MKTRSQLHSFFQRLALVTASLSLTAAAFAQSGTWINASGGSWTNSANWKSGVIANGTDSTADFSTLTLSADAVVTLDGGKTVGQMVFGDRGAAHNWILNTGSGGVLTFSGSAAPASVTVSNQTATLGVALAGTIGLTKNGAGTLVMAESPEYSEGTTNIDGTLELFSILDTSNNPAFSAPLIINGGVVESFATLNLDVNQNNDSGSVNVEGSGTLRLMSTSNNESNSPDLFFCPDAVANDYYGAALDVSNLDLGDLQRFVFALTEHNAISRYDPYEDARIDANVMGTAGITYVAQNNYGASMECQLVLAGSNTFTGMVEIRRGSIYLLNSSALVQTNKLLLDPTNGNNARLFLYGNAATIANLESSGAGTPLIANGNVNNPITIAPATLTVMQTSNTLFAGALVDGQYEYDAGSTPPGSLSLVKAGPGTLTLSGANTYTGFTSNLGGGLVISTAQIGGGPFALADGTTLGITGIDANTINMSDLALGTGGDTTLNFAFAGRPFAYLAALTTTTLEANGGAGSVTINIDTNSVGIATGQFPLIQYTSGSIGGSGAGFAAFRLGALPAGIVASLVNDTANNSVDLLVTTGTAVPLANGTWIKASGGSWAGSANWQGGVVAQGLGYTADFSTLTLSANPVVTLDGALTIGNLVFGDRGNAHSWALNTGFAGPLTLRTFSGAPSIIVSNQTATLGVVLAGTQGLNQGGSGTLVLMQPPRYSGGTTNSSGTLVFLSSINTSNNPVFNSPLVINGLAESAETLNLDVNQNNSFGSTNVQGPGTLRLVGTDNNGISSPDLFFCPDAVANDFYGAALDVSTLDLGSSQRYIFALCEHNAIARYDPYEDARIDANIIGSGGISYVAQNTYGGGTPMECQLVLAGSNTFTGTVEIQRGSIYLLNPSALVQTNKLLLDPTNGNNARLFLYGNAATIANLESRGAGTPLIANGNVNNSITIAPATLTVMQTSNTVFSGALLDGQYEYDAGGLAPGSLSLVKLGSGALTITGANGYSGATSVNAGELIVSSPQTNGSAFSVADGAAFGIIGIDTNGVAMSDLSLGNSTLEFTFAGAPGSTPAPVTTSTLEANRGENSVTINIYSSGAGFLVGQFPLIQYGAGGIGGSGAGFGAFRLGTLPAGTAASLVNNTANSSVDLKITSVVTVPSVSGVQWQANGTLNISLTGVPGTVFTVLATTNLALRPLSAWTVAGNGTIGTGVTVFNDPNAGSYPERFYVISTP